MNISDGTIAIIFGLAYVIPAVGGLITQFRADADTYISVTIQAVGVAICIACPLSVLAGSENDIGLAAVAMPVSSIATFILAVRAKGHGHSLVAFASVFYLVCFIGSFIYLIGQMKIGF